MGIARRNTIYIALLAGLGLCLFVTDLGHRDLWDIDEGMHAAIAQTMLLTGDWVTPAFNGEPFLDKPPLSNWMTAVSFRLLGLTEFAARLPVALCALACLLVTYLAGRKVYSEITGFLAACVLATSLYFLALSRYVQYDVPFTLFTTLAIFCYVSMWSTDRPRSFVIGLYAVMGLAVLVKGPLGAVIPGLAIAAHLLLTRKFRLLSRVLDPVGIAVFVLIAVPWIAMMERANPGYLSYFLVQQHFANLFGQVSGYIARHPEPFYYYLPATLIALIPWSLVLPQAIYNTVRHEDDGGDGLPMFLVIWLAVTLAVLSLATSKLSNYVLPLLPAAAILIGRDFERLYDGSRGDRQPVLAVLTAGSAVALFALTLFVIVADPWTHLATQSGVRWVHFERFMIGLTGLVLLASAAAYGGRHRATFAALASITPFTVFFILWVLAPTADAYRGAKDIGLQLDQLQPAGEEIYFMGRLPDSAMFYTQRDAVRLRNWQELHDYLASPQPVYALITGPGRAEIEALDGNFYVVSRIGNKAIVSNRPREAPEATGE